MSQIMVSTPSAKRLQVRGGREVGARLVLLALGAGDLAEALEQEQRGALAPPRACRSTACARRASRTRSTGENRTYGTSRRPLAGDVDVELVGADERQAVDRAGRDLPGRRVHVAVGDREAQHGDRIRVADQRLAGAVRPARRCRRATAPARPGGRCRRGRCRRRRRTAPVGNDRRVPLRRASGVGPSAITSSSARSSERSQPPLAPARFDRAIRCRRSSSPSAPNATGSSSAVIAPSRFGHARRQHGRRPRLRRLVDAARGEQDEDERGAHQKANHSRARITCAGLASRVVLSKAAPGRSSAVVERGGEAIAR